MDLYQNRGYLQEDFRLFHIRDQVSLSEIEFHCHDFHKLLFFVSGTASYIVEGKRYDLSPGDVAVVERGCVHRPEVGLGVPYERYVLYLSPDFVQSRSDAACSLDTCLTRARQQADYLLRPDAARARALTTELESLERALAGDGYGSQMRAGLLVQQLLIDLARLSLDPSPAAVPAVYDEKVVAILQYLNDHLTEPMTIDSLAARFYISKYHMMRRFRAQTGDSIHNYLTHKRLLYARDLLGRGLAATEVCYQCGYQDYSAFARAYKSLFAQSPGSLSKGVGRKNG